MVNKGLAEKAKKDILSGRVKLPIANTRLTLRGKTCYIPGTPDRVDIKRVEYFGCGHYSVPEGSYDLTPGIETARDMLKDINCPLLREYDLQVKYVQGINGPLPLDGKLYGMDFDDTIVLRPVGRREVGNFDLKAWYNQLLQEISMGTYVTTHNVGIEQENFQYWAQSDETLGGAGRTYGFDNGPLMVHRMPSWMNVNTSGAEKAGRVPLEILTNLLEPITSRRIMLNSSRIGRALKEEVAEMKLLGLDDDIKEMYKQATEMRHELTAEILGEERSLATGIVKEFLIKKAKEMGLKEEEILDWNPYGRFEHYSPSMTSQVQEELARYSPSQMIMFYDSTLWDKWVELGEDLDVSRLDSLE